MIVTIHQGDSLSSLLGSWWKRIYDLPRNKSFREKYPNPDHVEVGAEIFMPTVRDHDLDVEESLTLVRPHLHPPDALTESLLLKLQESFERQFNLETAFGGSLGLWLQRQRDFFGDIDVFTPKVWSVEEIPWQVSCVETNGIMTLRFCLDLWFSPRISQNRRKLIPWLKERIITLQNGIRVIPYELIRAWNLVLHEELPAQDKGRQLLDTESVSRETLNEYRRLFCGN